MGLDSPALSPSFRLQLLIQRRNLYGTTSYSTANCSIMQIKLICIQLMNTMM